MWFICDQKDYALMYNRGSYGVVRRVIDKNSGNQYAAKFLRFGDQLVKEELEMELEMMALLDHRHITQVRSLTLEISVFFH